MLLSTVLKRPYVNRCRCPWSWNSVSQCKRCLWCWIIGLVQVLIQSSSSICVKGIFLKMLPEFVYTVLYLFKALNNSIHWCTAHFNLVCKRRFILRLCNCKNAAEMTNASLNLLHRPLGLYCIVVVVWNIPFPFDNYCLNVEPANCAADQLKLVNIPVLCKAVRGYHVMTGAVRPLSAALQVCQSSFALNVCSFLLNTISSMCSDSEK